MNFTQKQIYEILEQVVCKEEGLEQLLKMSMEVLIKTEREEHNDMFSDLSNGYRPRKTFGIFLVFYSTICVLCLIS
jgi:hypothetical protein